MFSMKLKNAILFYGCQWTKIDSPLGKLVGIFFTSVGILGGWSLVAEILVNMMMGKRTPVPGRCKGHQDWSVLAVGTWSVKYWCICFLVREIREKWHLERSHMRFVGLLLVHSSLLCWALAMHGSRGDSVCTSSSQGANARQWCQELEDSKQGQSVPLCRKKVCFYELDSTWMK